MEHTSSSSLLCRTEILRRTLERAAQVAPAVPLKVAATLALVLLPPFQDTRVYANSLAPLALDACGLAFMALNAWKDQLLTGPSSSADPTFQWDCLPDMLIKVDKFIKSGLYKNTFLRFLFKKAEARKISVLRQEMKIMLDHFTTRQYDTILQAVVDSIDQYQGILLALDSHRATTALHPSSPGMIGVIEEQSPSIRPSSYTPVTLTPKTTADASPIPSLTVDHGEYPHYDYGASSRSPTYPPSSHTPPSSPVLATAPSDVHGGILITPTGGHIINSSAVKNVTTVDSGNMVNAYALNSHNDSKSVVLAGAAGASINWGTVHATYHYHHTYHIHLFPWLSHRAC